MNDKVNFEELIDSGELAVAKAFKESIKSYFRSLSTDFDADFGREFLYRHTKKLDEYLTQILRYTIRMSFGEYVPMQSSLPIALVALGSYGRQQLAVYSDIDVMILYKNIEGYNLKPLMERFVTTAWDAGLKVGHRVHEIDEITTVAQTDHTIKSALLESRFLTGSKFLWIEYQNKLAIVRKTNPQLFFKQKLDEASARAVKFPISMEPNIKECAGGLRSGNTLFWLATSLYANASNKDLVGKLYGEHEYKEYRSGLEFIFRLRIALHLEANKKQDTLIMQYQRLVALKLGFKDAAFKRAEYALVAKTLKSMAQVNLFCQTYIQKLSRRMFYGKHAFKDLIKCPKGFYLTPNSCLAVRYSKPNIALDAAILDISQLNAAYVDASVIYWLKNSLNPTCLDARFWILLFSCKNSYTILKAVYESGRITDILPPFENILHLAQFDGYHTYPADIHTLECIKAIENIQSKPVVQAYEKLSEFDKAFLKLLLIFHDIGKGKRQHHSIVGAKIFASFAKKAGFEQKYIELGKTVILHHVLMSDTALREDLNDEKTILGFAGKLESEAAVNLLYCLTYADINGVGAHIYTFVNAALLNELYVKALDKLGKKELLFETAARLEKEKALLKSQDFISLDKQTCRAVKTVKSNLFFMKHDAKQITQIAIRVKQTNEYSFEIKNEPVLELEIIRKKPINLGWLLGKLAFLDITSMDVFKLFDNAKFFRISFGEPVGEDDLPRITDWIHAAFDMSKKADYKRPVIERKNITLDCTHSDDYAKMQLSAKNQHGLLAFIIEVFDEFDIDIATAKISTIRQTARDMFLIEKSSGICDKKTKVFKKLCENSQKGKN